MPVVLRRYPIAYYATPKVACTSIKLALYELDRGKPFEDRQDENGTWIHIHGFWQGTPAFAPLIDSDLYYKFAVVRDPIQRLLSAYANRVVHHGELNESSLYNVKGELANLKPNPSLEEFIFKLHFYRQASATIKHHTDPQFYFIGKNLSYYDRIFRFTELAEIAHALKAAVGAEITLPKEQSEGPKLLVADLSKDERRRISEFYAEDYLLLNDFYRSD